MKEYIAAILHVIAVVIVCNAYSQGTMSNDIDNLMNSYYNDDYKVDTDVVIEKLGSGAIPELNRYLTGSDKFLQSKALELILQIDINQNKNLLLEYYDVNPKLVRNKILSTEIDFSDVDRKAFIEFFRAILKNDKKFHYQVPLILAKLGDKDSIPLLKQLLLQSNIQVNSELLSNISESENELVSIPEFRSINARCIEIALGKLGDDETIVEIVTRFVDSTTTQSKMNSFFQLTEIRDRRTLYYVRDFIYVDNAVYEGNVLYGIPARSLTEWVVENELPHLKPKSKNEEIIIYGSEEGKSLAIHWLNDNLDALRKIAILNTPN